MMAKKAKNNTHRTQMYPRKRRHLLKNDLRDLRCVKFGSGALGSGSLITHEKLKKVWTEFTELTEL
jgi:hypothetical protein